MEVLQLLSSGRSTREIGRELYLSEATVRNHIRGLLQAFGAHSQLEVLARSPRTRARRTSLNIGSQRIRNWKATIAAAESATTVVTVAPLASSRASGTSSDKT